MRRAYIVAVLLLAWASSAVATHQDVLTQDGLGAVRVGMTVRAAEEALGVGLRMEYPEAVDNDKCGYGRRADGQDQEVGYMIEGSRITRIDISAGKLLHSRFTTALGFGLGSNESDIKRAYGHYLTVKPHPYLEDAGSYLIIDSPDHREGIIFETDHGRVTSFRAGIYPSLGYIEGCM